MPSALQAEIRQTKPFASVREEAYLSIIRTAAVLGHASGEALKARGITTTQYNALRILRGAGSAGLCRNEVRDRLVAQVPDASRLLDRLEQMRLIERTRSTDDRRYVATRITDAGLALLRTLDLPVTVLLRAQLGHVSDTKLRTLIDILAQVRQPLQRRLPRPESGDAR